MLSIESKAELFLCVLFWALTSRLSLLTKGFQITREKLFLIRFEPGFLAHLFHPRAPFWITVNCRIVKLVTTGAFGRVEFGCATDFLKRKPRRSGRVSIQNWHSSAGNATAGHGGLASRQPGYGQKNNQKCG